MAVLISREAARSTELIIRSAYQNTGVWLRPIGSIGSWNHTARYATSSYRYPVEQSEVQCLQIVAFIIGCYEAQISRGGRFY